MARIFSKTKSFKRQGVTIVVLLLLLAAYYAVVVPTQTRYFTNRYFRLLAATGSHLKEIIRHLDSGLANAAASDGKAATPELRTNRIHGAVALIPNLTQPEVTLTNALPAAQGLRLQVAPDNRTPTLELDYATKDVRIRARTELPRMIEPFVSRSEFDDVLLVGANGEVFYQMAASPLVVARLEVPAARSFATNLVNLAGSDYRLFAQPVRIPAASAGGKDAPALDWVLCGLVREDRFRERAWAVDYRVMAVFMLGALLLIVSWPFLNVWGGGLKGGLRVGEKFLLGLSTLFVTAVLTLLVLDRYAYRSVRQQVDEQLEKVAGSISTNLNSELCDVAEQLDRLNAKWLELGPHPAFTNRPNLLADQQLMDADLDTEPYPWLRMVFWTDTNGMQVGKWTIKSRNTPFISVASRAYFRNIAEERPWTKRVQGTPRQFSLEPIHSLNTGESLAIYATQMSNRLAGVSAIDLRLLSLVNPVVPAGYGFAVIDAEGQVLFHADEQRNLRENFFVECGDHAHLRAAVYGRTAHSFSAPYFRTPHRMFVTPLMDLPWSLVVFRELDRLQVAQINIISVAGLLFLSYTLLALAVFAALYFAGAPRGSRWLWPQPQALATYWWLTLLHFVVVVVAGTVAMLNPEPWFTLLVALAAPCTGLILTRMALERGWRAPRGFELPPQLRRLKVNHRHGYVASMGMLLILLALIPTLAFFRIAFDKESQLLVKQTQLKLAGSLQARADRIRMEFKGGMAPDGAQLQPLAVPDARAFLKHRLTNRLDIYGFNDQWAVQELPPPTRAATGTNPRAWFNNLLRQVRPHYNKLDVEPGGLLQDAATDDSWQWLREAADLVLYKGAFRFAQDDAAATLRIQSRLPRLPFPGPVWLAVFAVLVSVPFFVIYVGADKVLLLNVAPSVVSQREWPPGKYLLLGPPHANKADWLTPAHFTALARTTKPPFLHLDLRRAADRQWLEPARQDDLFKDTGLPIVVDHFDYNLADPEFNKAKFRFLQQLAHDEKRSVILVSNVHPLHFPVADRGKTSNPKPRSLVSEKAHRADLLAAYKRLYKENEFDDPLEPLSPDVTYHRARAHYRSIWMTCSPKEQEILYHLALGRLISSDHPEIRTLLARKLAELNPELRLMPDNAFRHFIVTHYQPEPDEESEESASLWQAAKGPAITVLIIVAAFFFVTQRALWDYTIGLVPAFMAGLGALAHVINLAQKQKLKRAVPEE